jgi:hypothetical protein
LSDQKVKRTSNPELDQKYSSWDSNPEPPD